MSQVEDLVRAAYNGEIAEVTRLLDAGVPVDGESDICNALHAAIENENTDCVMLLVDRGANIEHCNGGLTPLAHAVDTSMQGTIQSNRAPGTEPTAVIEFLLSRGANPKTAYEMATRYKSERIIGLLKKFIETR